MKTKDSLQLAKLVEKAKRDYYHAKQLDGKVMLNISTGLIATIHLVRYNWETNDFSYEDDRRRMFSITDIPTDNGQYLEAVNGARYIICQDKAEAETVRGRIIASDDPEIKNIIPKVTTL